MRPLVKCTPALSATNTNPSWYLIMLLGQHCANVVPPLCQCCANVAPPLCQCCANVAPPLCHRYDTTMPTLWHNYSTVVPPLNWDATNVSEPCLRLVLLYNGNLPCFQPRWLWSTAAAASTTDKVWWCWPFFSASPPSPASSSADSNSRKTRIQGILRGSWRLYPLAAKKRDQKRIESWPDLKNRICNFINITIYWQCAVIKALLWLLNCTTFILKLLCSNLRQTRILRLKVTS